MPPRVLASGPKPCGGNKQMIGQMAIARALRGFNDLGRSVTPTFLLMDHFLY